MPGQELVESVDLLIGYAGERIGKPHLRIAPLLPKPANRGRKPGVDMREVLNAIRYMTRSGASATWRWTPTGAS